MGGEVAKAPVVHGRARRLHSPRLDSWRRERVRSKEIQSKQRGRKRILENSLDLRHFGSGNDLLRVCLFGLQPSAAATTMGQKNGKAAFKDEVAPFVNRKL